MIKKLNPNKKAGWLDIHNFLLEKASPYNKLRLLIEENGCIKLTEPSEKDLFRFICRIITGQQLSTQVAKSLWDKLNKLCLEEKKELRELFNGNSFQKIKDCGLSANKVLAMKKLHDSFTKGVINAQLIKKLEENEVINLITSLWGLGPWSAEMILIGYLANHDIWSFNDSSLQKGIGLALSEQDKPEKEIIESFSPYRTLLSRHIWKGLDEGRLA